tara:strand:- start:152 stop:949 length:798 start_codon:yes stop_codon:yes gene_type:complete
MKYLILLFVILFSENVKSKSFPEISGCFCEGGIITGKVSMNDSLIIDGKKLKIFDGGRFIFAFGRKFKKSVNIVFNELSKDFTILDKKYKIERIKGLPRNKVEPSQKDLDKIFSDQKKIKDSKKVGSKRKLFSDIFILPAEGRLSGVYGSQRVLNSKPRKPHNGIDIAAKEGTKIIAPSTGKVKLIAKNMFFTGNTIIIDHGLGLISIFAHLKDIYVNEKDLVNQGDKIGSIGMTGRATGPHLHWGVYLENTSVDPEVLLNFKLF